MTTRRGVVITTSGVLGGWLAVMTPAVVTIALRMREFDASGLPVVYSATLASGWAAMILALIAFGRLGDMVRRRTGSRVTLARIGAPLIALAGLLLAWAPSPGWLLVAWVLAQVPSAMIITTALAETGEVVSTRRRGLASGLIGAAPIIALMLGTVVVTALSHSMSLAFITTAVLATLLAVPLTLARGASPSPLGSTPATSLPTIRVDPVRVLPRSIWVTFLLASFMLSWATSTTNGFIVPYVQDVTDVSDDAVTGLSTSAVLMASVLAAIASIVGGALAGGRRRGLGMWSAAALACAIGLITILVVPTTTGVLITAVAFGAGFGLANGVELGIVLLLRTDIARLGRDLGLFTAVTSAPYVLVPALATLLLAGSASSGLVQLFTLALLFGIGAAVTVALLSRRLRVPRQRSTAPQA